MAKRILKHTEEVEPQVVEEPKEEPSKSEPKKKAFVSTDGILCSSVTPGQLFVEGPKTGMTYTFADYGDETEIEYRDLTALVMTKSVSVFGPRFVIKDEDFVAEMPQLEAFYAKQFSVKDLRKILTMPVEGMIKTIKELPKGAQDNLKIIAATAVENGSLDSIRKIKALDELWGTQFNFFSETEE